MNTYPQKIALLILLATIQLSHADNDPLTLSTSQTLTDALAFQNNSDPQLDILDVKEPTNFSQTNHALNLTLASADIYADYGAINSLTSNDIYTNSLESDYSYSNVSQSNQMYTDYLDAYSANIGYLNTSDIHSDYITSNHGSISNLWVYETYSDYLYTNYGSIDQLASNNIATQSLEANQVYSNYLNANYGDIHDLSSNYINTNTLEAAHTYSNYISADYGYIDALSSNDINTNTLQANDIYTNGISLSPLNNNGIDLGSYTVGEAYSSVTGLPSAVDHYRDQSGKDFYVVRDTKEVYEKSNDGIKRSSADTSSMTWIRSGEISTYLSGSYMEITDRKITKDAVSYGEQNESITQADAQFNFAGESYTAVILDDSSVTSTSNELVSGVIRPYSSDLDDKYGVRATSSKDGEVVAETVLTSSGLTTTGQIQAKTIVLDGQDLTTKIEQGDQSTLLAANTYTQNQVTQASENTLKAAKAEDVKVLASANQYTDTQIGIFNSHVSRLNQRIDDVKDTAYRGVAIALAAQQQIPNIGAGQMAVFGGVGHYEGETAGALGLAGVLPNGRTSLSAAFGAAGQGDVGGRVGVAYVFGGK